MSHSPREEPPVEWNILKSTSWGGKGTKRQWEERGGSLPGKVCTGDLMYFWIWHRCIILRVIGIIMRLLARVEVSESWRNLDSWKYPMLPMITCRSVHKKWRSHMTGSLRARFSVSGNQCSSTEIKVVMPVYTTQWSGWLYFQRSTIFSMQKQPTFDENI